MIIHVQVFVWMHVCTYVGWNHWVISSAKRTHWS